MKALGALKHPILSDSVKFAISDNGEAGEVGEAEDLYAVPVVTVSYGFVCYCLFSLSGSATPSPKTPFYRRSLALFYWLFRFPPFHPNFNKIFRGVTAVISEVSTFYCKLF